MADARSFDQWRKDVFFSAAEEVQESADALESVYRMWIRYRNDGFEQEISDELLREVRTALGTAKWQLEEFAKAVGSTHDNYSAKDNTISRHRNFIAALGNQISFIEKAMSDTLVEDGKQPLHWVQLNEEERDDLAIFLSTASQTTQKTDVKYADNGRYAHQVRTTSAEVAAKLPLKDKVEVVAEEQFAEQKRTLSSPDMGAWKIAIADNQDADRKIRETMSEIPARASDISGSLRSDESTAKPKIIRNSFSKAKSGHHIPLNQHLQNYIDLKGLARVTQGLNERSRNCFAGCSEDFKGSNGQQLMGRASGLQRHIQGLQYYMQFGRSIRITILLLLTIVLIVPFLLCTA